MKLARRALQARSRLDERFEIMRPVNRFAPPVRGWIKAIREGLGISSTQLAERLGIKQPSVSDLEQSEMKGTIELATLRRVAQSLDCTLIYALVPNEPLETFVQDRARTIARRRIHAIGHSMALEDQKVGDKETEAQIDELVRTMKPSRLWDDA
jgi:predicted DNA-binding mobile mystery protein A